MPRWFDVRRGEYGRTLRAGGAMFAILAGHTISETVRDALFLGANGASGLALVYLLLAGFAVVALAANARLVKRLGRRYALIVTLLAATAGSTLFALARQTPDVAFALYLWTGLLGTVVVVQFWLLAATSFTTTEAKRLYGPIAAAGAVGTLVGALSAWALLRVLAPQHLLVVAAGFYGLGGALLARDRESIEPRLRAQERSVAKPAVARMQGRPYVARLAVLAVCATAAALLADYLLKATAVATLRPDELPRFFARYNGAVSALSLVLQVLGTTWLVRRVGVLGMAMLLPVLMLTGGVAAVVTGGAFVAVALTKGSDSSLRYSVTRVATELLWMPVAEDVRVRVREPLESVVTRLVQAVIAGLLLALSALGLAGPIVIAGILVGIALVWTVTAGELRKSYLVQLRTSVSRRTIGPGHELDLKGLETVVEALSSDDDVRVIAAIQILNVHHRSRLIPALVLRHDSIEVLAAALDAIATPGRTDWKPLAHRLLQQPGARTRALALRALARSGDTMAIINGLADHDPGVLAHAVFWKVQSGTAARSLEDPAVGALLAETGERGAGSRRQLLDAIRIDGDGRWIDALLALAAQVDGASIEGLALAIARVPDPRFVPMLVDRLGTRAGRAHVRSALVAIGEPALVALETALEDPETANRTRLHLPSAIALFGTQAAAQALGRQLARVRSGAVRYRLLRALARLAVGSEIILDAEPLLIELHAHLREHFRLLARGIPVLADADPRDSAVLLRGLIGDKISQALDRAFLALQSLHPREDIREVSRALVGTDRRARAHGMELLDTLTRTSLYAREAATGIRALLLLLGDDLEPRDQVVRAGLADKVPATVADALALLVQEGDALLAACAGYHALQLQSPELDELVDDIVRARPLFAPLGIVHASHRGA